MSSDSFNNSIVLSYPNISGRFPPTSGDKDNLPSENAPAPANPVVIEHGLHPTHTFVFRFGQALLSILRPFSIIRTFISGLFLFNS